ncbi:MAG: ComF family protein, partial [Candidatus Eremiobacteraeota bacterium]|nr:ComF family protein [Candidatus Eremiobacteraeota bacterium]
MLRLLLDAIAPPLCAGCDRLGPFCDACRTALSGLRPVERRDIAGVERVLALGPYEGVLRRCVLALKFANRRDVAVQLGRMLATSWPLDMDFLVPVPLHPARQAARGYNQAHLLAQALEEAMRLQPRSARLVVVDGLRRE